MCARRFSIVPYFFINGSAVFGPTPATPGTLSDWSPIRPSISMTCSGGTPNFSMTPDSSTISSSFPPFPGRYNLTVGETSCMKSLSLVTRNVSTFSFSARLASVPITSSASKPGSSTTGTLNARTTSFNVSIMADISSGIFCRVALYSGYALWRNVGSIVSKTTAM